MRAAKQKGPYVLVAHSWGGLIARLYASTYPDEVSGLVLLDAGSEFMQDTLTPAQWDFLRPGSKKLGEPKDLRSGRLPAQRRALRAAPPVGEIPAVVLSSDKCWFVFPGFDARGETMLGVACGSGSTRRVPRRQAHHRYEQRPLHPRGES